MNKHTPGPWNVVAIDWDEQTGNARFEIDGIRATGMADARLIAAAPDLLEAVNILLPLAEDAFYHYGVNPKDCNEIKLAIAVIAKATGDA